VVNCKSGVEIWISRRMVGEVSRIDDPVLIVGLNRELEYKGGTVWPYQRRVIEMPVAVGGSLPTPGTVAGRGAPAHVVGIRLESKRPPHLQADRRRAAGGHSPLRGGSPSDPGGRGQAERGLHHQGSAVPQPDQPRRLLRHGAETGASPRPTAGRASRARFSAARLGYPDRKYTVILMGSARQTAVYIGTMDENWKPVHSVDLHSGGTTASLLRSLKRF